MSRTIFFSIFSGLVLSAAACTGGSVTSTADGEPTSYYADIKPLLDEKCVSCHQPGQIGSGDLTNYDSASLLANLIEQQVTQRLMPPWLADGDCHEYQNDHSLSDEQIATFGRWAQTGAAEGDPADAPTTKAPPPTVLKRIDHEIAMPVDYQPDASSNDDYRCFLIDWPETERKYVTGFGVRAGDTSTVHHVIAYVAGPDQVEEYEALDAADPGEGYRCYGGPGGAVQMATTFFGAWAPGVADAEFPEGTGVPIRPGSKVVLQMHYNLVASSGGADRSSVVVSVEDTVAKEASFEFFSDPKWVFGRQMPIAAGEPSVTHSTAIDPTSWMSGGKPMTIYNVGMHMHERGVAGRLELDRGGEASCLLDIPRWDFNWQFSYRLKEPLHFNPGDKLRMTCNWDNSIKNQPLVDGVRMPPQDLNWGDGTADEMCLGILYVVPD